jgi:hypothetical protein
MNPINKQDTNNAAGMEERMKNGIYMFKALSKQKQKND